MTTATRIPGAASTAVASIAAPARHAGDSVATALGSVVDTAAERGRKARRRAGRRARAEIAHQRRVIRKQAKIAKKRSGKAWTDFAEETTTRAADLVAASKGGRDHHQRTTRGAVVLVAVAGAIAVIVVRRNQAASQSATGSPGSRPDDTPASS